MVEENKPSLDKQTVKALIEECGYMVCHTETERGREEEKQSYSDLNLSAVSTNYLEGREIIQLWKHQYLAVKAAKEAKTYVLLRQQVLVNQKYSFCLLWSCLQKTRMQRCWRYTQ